MSLSAENEPISLAEPTEADLKVTALLDDCLHAFGLFASQAELDQRVKVCVCVEWRACVRCGVRHTLFEGPCYLFFLFVLFDGCKRRTM